MRKVGNAQVQGIKRSFFKHRLAHSKEIWLIEEKEVLIYLRCKDVENIYQALVQDFSAGEYSIVPAGIKDEHNLHSALMRYRTSLGTEVKYPTAPMAAAALMHSLIHDHPFHKQAHRACQYVCLS